MLNLLLFVGSNKYFNLKLLSGESISTTSIDVVNLLLSNASAAIRAADIRGWRHTAIWTELIVSKEEQLTRREGYHWTSVGVQILFLNWDVSCLPRTFDASTHLIVEARRMKQIAHTFFDLRLTFASDA